jgi:hypothetical protein
VIGRVASGLSATIAVAVLAGCYGSTEPATDIGIDRATLRAFGDTERSPTISWFQYWPGTSPSDGVRTTPSRDWPAGVRGPLSESVTGLAPNTLYSFRLCGTTEGRPAVCAQTRTFRTLDGDVVKAYFRASGGGEAELYAVSGAHGEAPRGFLAFAPPSPSPVEDVVCLAVRGDEAVIGTRVDGPGGRLVGLRAGINPVTLDSSSDPTTCAAVRVGDLPPSSVEANTQIHDAP